MKTKKAKKADLNNYTSTFFLMGLVMMLFISWKTIELTTKEQVLSNDTLTINGDPIEKTLEVKVEEIKPIVKKIMPKEIVELDVKKDEEKVKETMFKSLEDDEDDPIKSVAEIDYKEVVKEEPPVDWIRIEQAPIFPGCEGRKGKALKKCVSDKIGAFVGEHFDKEVASDLDMSGRIRIMTQFTIDKTGKIVNIKTRAKDKDLEKEARRVIGKLPKMKPGKQRNVPVKVTYTLPIIFNIEE